MSDVIELVNRNSAQMRHVQAYLEEEERRELEDLEVIRIVNKGTERRGGLRYPDNDRKFMKRNKSRKAKAAQWAGRMALVMSAASLVAGMELVFPLWLLVAVLFYALYFELKGRDWIWI